MMRAAVTLCLMSRVICVLPVRRHLDSYHAPRHTRSTAVHEDGFVFNHFGSKPGTYSGSIGDTVHKYNKYSIIKPYRIQSVANLRMSEPHYTDYFSFSNVITDRVPPYTTTPSKYETEYEISRARANSEYMSNYVPSDVKTDIMIARLKSMMHYEPPKDVTNTVHTFYDNNSDFSNDDDDIRSSGRTMYDHYWPDMYHGVYEYEHNKIKAESDKAKDKRYADLHPVVKPVHEEIENDVPNVIPLHTDSPIDNPIRGNGPFFSFVLNDYFDKNNDDDIISLKGIDSTWEKEFDHETQTSSDNKKPKEYNYDYNYLTPVIETLTTVKPHNSLYVYPNSHVTDSPIRIRYDSDTNQLYDKSQPASTFKSHKYSGSQQDLQEDVKQNHGFDKHEKGKNKLSSKDSGHESDRRKYDEFKDFLDGVSSKFGLEDHKKEANYANENNAEKGEKKKGFHRVYHKNEFQEDKEFFDNSKNSAKAQENGHGKVHIGGSDGLLRTQALAALGSNADAFRQSGINHNKGFENSHKGDNDYNLKNSKLRKFVDVAKQVAQSNEERYPDIYEAWPGQSSNQLVFIKTDRDP